MSTARRNARARSIKALMRVIDAKGDAATFGDMADAVIDIVEPTFYEEGRRAAESTWPRMRSAIQTTLLANLQGKVDEMLTEAKGKRDALKPVEDMREDPYGYGQRMHAAGYVVGIAEVLFGPLDAASPSATVQQEWVIVCDGDPRMDGSYARRQIGGPFTTLSNARAAYDSVVLRSTHDPKVNLRIERRVVGPWEVQS
jgi:hypothetical protein